jgi:limonene-1,2-epoxide hydrolase
MTGSTSASQSTNDTAANARVVETFLYALQDQDFDTAESTLADNILYQNVGYTTMRGRRRIMKLFRMGQGRGGFEVKIHRIAAEGNAVLTERTDAIIIGPLRLQVWVCGVFEVHGGKITLWRDYFDAFEFFVTAPVRAIVGIFIPSLRPTM